MYSTVQYINLDPEYWCIPIQIRNTDVHPSGSGLPDGARGTGCIVGKRSTHCPVSEYTPGGRENRIPDATTATATVPTYVLSASFEDPNLKN